MEVPLDQFFKLYVNKINNFLVSLIVKSCFSKQESRDFAANSHLIILSLQPVGVNLRCFKLRLVDLTELLV